MKSSLIHRGCNGLNFNSASIDARIVSVNLTGSWPPAGDSSGFYMRRLINCAVFEFDNIDIVKVYLNDGVFDRCVDGQPDLSKGNCDTASTYWVDSR